MMNISEKLNGISEGLGFLLPELTIVFGIILITIADLIYPDGRRRLKLGLMLAIVVVAAYLLIDMKDESLLFNGMLYIGSFQRFMKLLMLLAVGLIVFFSFSSDKKLGGSGEYAVIMLAITLGGCFLIAVRHLLLFYVAIEVISISSYVLVTFNKNKRGFEGGIKYLLFGAISSGVMLYGISLLYGFTGSLDIAEISLILENQQILFVPLIMFLAGILFKLSAIPFHIWTPQAYEGAPTVVAAFLSTVPKIAAIGFLMHLLIYSTWFLNETWIKVLAVIAMVTISIGNFSALWQSNPRRLLAYSSIAHSGFLILGLVAQSDVAFESVIFYTSIYIFMNLGAFYLVQLFENEGLENIKDLAGVGKQLWIPGLLMVVVMIALTGLPPTAGFTAKLLVFASFYEIYSNSKDPFFATILGVAIFNAAISLVYYLKMPYYLFIKNKEFNNSLRQSPSKIELLFATFLILQLLIVFLRPEILTELINSIKLSNY